MKRRLLSLFLAFVTILSLLPTAAFAASSEEDALGEVDIYNGDYELGYLAINGAVKKQKYTYFLYESNDGSTKESPAYCVNPNQYPRSCRRRQPQPAESEEPHQHHVLQRGSSV